MSCKVEKIGENKAKFTIEVGKEEFLKAEDKVYNKEKGKLSAPGFRKGKVTKEMAHKVYGRGVFLEDAVNQCINDTYYNEIKESGERILSQPKINVVQVDFEKPFIYEAEVAIAPPIKLGKYKGLKLEKTNIVVSDEDVMHKIDEEREKNARLVSVDRKSKMGDTINIAFDGYVDGKEFEGGKADSYDLVLGSHSFIDNFEDQLVDKGRDDEVDVNVTFPENYHEKNLAGKPALFKVKVHEVKEKQLPELDDEFVSEVSEFETLDEYKNDIKKKLTELRERQIKEDDKGKLLDMVVKETPISLADEAIDAQVDEMMQTYDNRLRYQGIDLKRYLEMLHKTEEDYRKEIRPRAEMSVKNSLVMDEIAKVENIVASDEMVDEELTAMAKSYGMDVEKFKESYANEEDKKRLKDDLLYPAVLNFLYDNAEIK
ncbi:MAG: trigger factor [Lachnospiraceae bacterium]|nr:trigger factor [Lachnospiraceae bacterium]